MADVDFGDLAVRVLTASGADRVMLEFQACWIALSSDSVMPLVWRTPQPWSEQDTRQMRGLRELADGFGQSFNFDAFRVSADAACAPFTRWRNAVHDYEGAQAARLTTLAWCYRTLVKSRESVDDKRVADQLIARASEFIDAHWNVGATFPVDGEYRNWAIRETRRYDLLPKTWRYV